MQGKKGEREGGKEMWTERDGERGNGGKGNEVYTTGLNCSYFRPLAQSG